jgi:hypothetical protein
LSASYKAMSSIAVTAKRPLVVNRIIVVYRFKQCVFYNNLLF